MSPLAKSFHASVDYVPNQDWFVRSNSHLFFSNDINKRNQQMNLQKSKKKFVHTIVHIKETIQKIAIACVSYHFMNVIYLQ